MRKPLSLFLLMALHITALTNDCTCLNQDDFKKELQKADSLKETNPTKAINIAVEAKSRICKKDQEKLIQLDLVIANAFSFKGNYDSSLQILETVESTYKIDTNTEYQAIIHHQKGINFTRKGNYQEALRQLNKSFEYYDQLNDSRTKVIILKDIGNVHFFANEKEVARSFYEKALILGKELPTNDVQAGIFNNLGRIYIELNDLETAINYLQLSLNIKKQNKNYYGIANSYLNLGRVYELKNDFNSAEQYYLDATDLMKKVQNNDGLLKSHFYQGNIYSLLKKEKLAHKNYLQAIEIADHIKSSYMQLLLYKEYANYLKSLDHKNKAIYYLEKHIKLQDSLVNTIRTSFYGNYKIENVAFDKHYNQLLTDIQKNRRHLKFQKLKDYSLTITIIIILVIFIHVGYYQRTKAKLTQKSDKPNEKAKL